MDGHTDLGQLLATFDDPPEGVARIDLRDQIASHGLAAVEPMSVRLAYPGRSQVAVRILERVARDYESARAAAIAALRRGATRPGMAPITRTDSVDALGRLKVPVQQKGSSSIPELAGSAWPGFLDSDFGRNEGSKWRDHAAPESLAPLLARELRSSDPGFISFGVDRRPEIHFAREDRYKGEPGGVRSSKLVVYADGPNDEHPVRRRRVVAGFCVEKGDGVELGPVDGGVLWDWPLFLAAIARPSVENLLSELMSRHGMAMGDVRLGQGEWVSLGWSVELGAGGVPVRQDHEGRELGRGWDDVRATLRALPAGTWHELHLWRWWPADEAVAAGRAFAYDALAPLLLDVAGLYLEVVDTQPEATLG